MVKCEYCKKTSNETYPIALYGTDDFYNLEVCNECYERWNDYFSPKEVDEIIKESEGV